MQRYSIFSTLCARNANQGLDNLILEFAPIWKKAGALTDPLTAIDDLKQLQSEAINLNQAFAKWQEAQVEEFNPWTVGHVSQLPARQQFKTGYWPGKVDVYFDLYVAGVWNTTRIIRVLLIDLIITLAKMLNNDCHNSGHQDALRLIHDIIASIPFHLAEDLHAFLRDIGDGNEASRMQPGRPIGGLLLMHPIYLASKLSMVPLQLQDYLKGCLEWIATNMGFGQASIFAKVRNISCLLKDFGPLS